ncbi:unnamed protein product, partial [Sphacelaria rigidula]
MLSTFLHVACDDDIRVEEIDVPNQTNPEPGSDTHSRILAVFSYVLLMLYRRSNPMAAAKASSGGKSLPSLASLASMADEADLLLSMVEDPGSFAIVVMKTLRGYFLLLKGRDQEVQEAVGLPVARALEADSGVLNFPLCWHMCQCVSAFLHRRGVHAAATGMERIMEPLRQTLVYSSTCCSVALDVFDVYAGKGTSTTGSGIFPQSCGDNARGSSPAGGGGRGGSTQSPTRNRSHTMPSGGPSSPREPQYNYSRHEQQPHQPPQRHQYDPSNPDISPTSPTAAGMPPASAGGSGRGAGGNSHSPGSTACHAAKSPRKHEHQQASTSHGTGPAGGEPNTRRSPHGGSGSGGGHAASGRATRGSAVGVWEKTMYPHQEDGEEHAAVHDSTGGGGSETNAHPDTSVMFRGHNPFFMGNGTRRGGGGGGGNGGDGGEHGDGEMVGMGGGSGSSSVPSLSLSVMGLDEVSGGG